MVVVAAADDSQGPSNIKNIQCFAMILQVIHYPMGQLTFICGIFGGGTLKSIGGKNIFGGRTE